MAVFRVGHVWYVCVDSTEVKHTRIENVVAACKAEYARGRASCDIARGRTKRLRSIGFDNSVVLDTKVRVDNEHKVG